MKMDHLIEALAADRFPMPAPHHPAYVMGYHDAQRGHTACPYGVPAWAAEWREGYDFADENGEALMPRFGKIAGKKRR